MIVRVFQKKRHPERLEIEAASGNQDGIWDTSIEEPRQLAANGPAAIGRGRGEV
jgi:hypothetical protein